MDELLGLLETWDFDRLHKFFTNFLLEEEVQVMHTMAKAFVHSTPATPEKLKFIDPEVGWLKKI